MNSIRKYVFPPLEFAGAKTFGTGVVVLTYHPSA